MISKHIFMWSVIVFSLVQLITCPPTPVNDINSVKSGVTSVNAKAPTATTDKPGNVQQSPAPSSRKSTAANPPAQSIAAPPPSGKSGVEPKQLQASSRKPSLQPETPSKPLKPAGTSTASPGLSSPAARPKAASPGTPPANPAQTPLKPSGKPVEALKNNAEQPVASRQPAKSGTRITDAAPTASAASNSKTASPVKPSVSARSLAPPPTTPSMSARSLAPPPTTPSVSARSLAPPPTTPSVSARSLAPPPATPSVSARSLAPPPTTPSVSARSPAPKPGISRPNTDQATTTRSASMPRAAIPEPPKTNVKRSPSSKSNNGNAAQTENVDYQSDGSKLQKQNSMDNSGIIKRWLVLKPISIVSKITNFLKNKVTRNNGENP